MIYNSNSEPIDGEAAARMQDLPRKFPVRGWHVLAVLMVLYMVSSLDRGLLSLLVKPVRHDLAITDLQMSLLLGVAFALFYAVCGLPIGWLVDRFSRRWILYFGISFWSIATIACGLSQTYSQLFLARMALGLGEASLGPAAHSIIADTFPKRQLATAMSVYTGGAVLGTGGSILLGGLAIGYLSHYSALDIPFLGSVRSWQAAFIILGVPGLVLAFAAFLIGEPSRAHLRKKAAPLRPFLLMRWKVLVCFAVAFAGYAVALYGTFLWMPSHMERHFGWSAGRAGPVLGAVNLIAVSIGTIGGGIIVDKLATRGHKDAPLRVFFAAIALGAPVGAVGFLLDDPRGFLICVAWLELLTFSYVGYAAAAIQAISPPSLRGRMAGFYLLALALVGNGVGPLLIAFLAEHLFHDPAKLGDAVATTIAIVTPIALTAAWLGMKHMRFAVAELEASSTSSPERDGMS